jgi:hypothetical protein
VDTKANVREEMEPVRNEVEVFISDVLMTVGTLLDITFCYWLKDLEVS